MGCKIEPNNKKEFGISMYAALKKEYGYKNHYEVSEIKEVFHQIGYPNSWLCWAMIAFMLPANVGEYFRAIGKPVNIVDMKRKFIQEMTDGKLNRLDVSTYQEPTGSIEGYNINIFNYDNINLVDIIDAYNGDDTMLEMKLKYNLLF